MSKDEISGKPENSVAPNGEGLKRRDLLLSGTLVGGRVGAAG